MKQIPIQKVDLKLCKSKNKQFQSVNSFIRNEFKDFIQEELEEIHNKFYHKKEISLYA